MAKAATKKAPAAPRKAPEKECPKCKNKVHVRSRQCKCGHKWEAPKKKKQSTKPAASGNGVAVDVAIVLDHIDKLIAEKEAELQKLKEARSLIAN